jgi:hypothetical protein
MGLSSVIREVIVLASRTKVEIDVPVRKFVIILILLNRTDYLCVPMSGHKPCKVFLLLPST